MSLINDALKRTQHTTQASEPPRLDEIELRPIGPSQQPPQNDGSGAKRWIWIIVLLVVASNIALWIVFKDRRNETEVAARTAKSEAAAPVTLESNTDPGVAQPVVTTLAEAAGTNSTVTTEATVLEVPIEEPLVIDRPEFKLKTIVIHPTRPSAMINNRILFVGDTVEGYSVKSISEDEVTLTTDGDEVVVTLP